MNNQNTKSSIFGLSVVDITKKENSISKGGETTLPVNHILWGK